jgi:hypothetical protein
MVQEDSGESEGRETSAKEEDLLTSLEGKFGTAEIFEIQQLTDDGDMRFEYQVRFGGEVETFKTLGEASLTAGDRAGIKG